MSTNDLNVALTLSLNDKLVAPLQEAVGKMQRQFDALERQAKTTTESLAMIPKMLTEMGSKATEATKAAAAVKKVADESKSAEREISRLVRTWGTLKGVAGNVSAGVAGVTAFNMIAADPLKRAADYDMSLRNLANTAYAGKPIAERRAGMGAMGAAVTGAVRFGGGTREGALETLNQMIASGTFGDDPSEAIQMLPGIIRAGTASGADPVSLSRIAVRAKQSMGLGSGDLGLLMDHAMIAGQAGGFELKDMAKWLPQQMALAGSLGMRGQKGISSLLAANQAAVVTAGTQDEAGNNVLNLLEHLNGHSTQHIFKTRFGVDLTGTLAKATENGMDPLDAIVALVDRIADKDPAYKKAKEKAEGVRGAKLTDAERKGVYESEASLLKGSVVGNMFPDRQALMGLIGLMNGRAYMTDIRAKMSAGKGAIEDNAALITEGAGYTYAQREFEQQKAQTEAMMTANGAVSKLAEAQIDLYRRYPGFAEALEGAKVTVMGVTAAIGAWGALKLLTGGAGALAAGAGAAEVAGVGAGAVGVGGSAAALGGSLAAPVIAGGLLLSAVAASVVQRNQDAFSDTADGGMLGAMSGDTGFAAAIMEATTATKEAAEATKEAAAATKEMAGRPVELHFDGVKVYESMSDAAERLGRRR